MEAKGGGSSGSGGASRPVKGILKNPSRAGLLARAAAQDEEEEEEKEPARLRAAAARQPEKEAAAAAAEATRVPGLEGKKSQKWDEMNILATYHPPGKDYGLMKIDEPSTPFHRMAGDDEDGGSDTEISEVPTADVLAKKLAAAAEGKGPKVLAHLEESSEEEEEEEADLSPEEREKKRQFEMKRKMHYNEAQNIKLARQLIAKELHGEAAEDEDEDDEEMKEAGETSPALVPPPAPPPRDSRENVAHSLEEVCSEL